MVASTAALKGYPYVTAYAAAKHGLLGLVRALAQETAARGVTVNAVCPGFTEADITADSVAHIMAKTGRDEGSARAELAKHNPQRRLVQPAEIAAAALAPNLASAADADEFFRQQADALVHLAQAFLAGGDSNSSTADHYQVMVHVDESALRDDGGKSDLPVESMRRLTCDASLVHVAEDDKGNVLNAGRKTRVVSPPMKRALLGRAKHCRFPGCSHAKWLDAHHVMHWADGGETSMDNTLLCRRMVLPQWRWQGAAAASGASRQSIT